jgi:hypothetical protein
MPDFALPRTCVIGAGLSGLTAGKAEKARWAASGRAEVRRYPIGHFDVYMGAARD